MNSAQDQNQTSAPQPKGRGFRWRGRITAVGLSLFGALALLSTPWMHQYPYFDEAVGACAWLCFLMGLLFRFWSALYLGGRKQKMVVHEGPYSMCRNPLYVGSFFIWCSLGLYLKSLTFLVGAVFVSLAYMFATVPEEERFLRGRFGAAFDEYVARVPRFIPRPSLFQSESAITVYTSSLRAELRRASRWVWIPVIAGFLTQLRQEDWWPHPIPFWLP